MAPSDKSGQHRGRLRQRRSRNMMNQFELTCFFFLLSSAFMTTQAKSVKKISAAFLKIGGK